MNMSYTTKELDINEYTCDDILKIRNLLLIDTLLCINLLNFNFIYENSNKNCIILTPKIRCIPYGLVKLNDISNIPFHKEWMQYITTFSSDCNTSIDAFQAIIKNKKIQRIHEIVKCKTIGVIDDKPIDDITKISLSQLDGIKYIKEYQINIDIIINNIGFDLIFGTTNFTKCVNIKNSIITLLYLTIENSEKEKKYEWDRTGYRRRSSEIQRFY